MHHSERERKRGCRRVWKRGIEQGVGVVRHEMDDFVRTTQRGTAKGKERGPWKQKRRENKRDNGQMRKRGKGWQTGERRGVKRTR